MAKRLKKLTEAAIEKMTPQEAMVACNERGLPEGTGEDMIQALLDNPNGVKDTEE